MKKIVYLCCLMLALVLFAQAAAAQDHGEVGLYGTFFRLGATDTNFGGLGGRASFNATKLIQLEAEMDYSFDQTPIEGFSTTGTGTVGVQRTNLRILHGLFGPKIQTNKGPVRLFLTAKGGFINFRIDDRPATFSTFAGSLDDLRFNNVNGVFYPGGGAEAFLGPIGLRWDVGDEIYFNNGARHNLRVTFGPHIRF
ncbi:MAG: hypothetical protein ACRD4K_05600 [Candidatus Acidiferrales bacterium]